MSKLSRDKGARIDREILQQKVAAICGFGSNACGTSVSPPPPPTVDPGTPGETINGSERIGWDQRAADTVELATFRYAVYVDGARAELTGATCAPSAPS